MSSRLSSFLRESGKLYVLYLAAGIAAIPAGVIYAFLVVTGYNRWWTVVPAIVLGFWMGRKAWKYVHGRLFDHGHNEVVSANANADILKDVCASEAILVWESSIFCKESVTGLNASASQSLPATNAQSANQRAGQRHAFAGN